MKRDERSGKYFIVEPNVGRPTGRSATAEAGGVELLYTMYCDALGLPLPMNREQKYTGVKWIYWRRDLQSALYRWWHGELTLTEWRQSWRGRKAYAVFSWRDPLPFLMDIVTTARRWFSTQEKRKKQNQHLSERN
jgi:predicted ATP-grasp superfamily ATP-dependent carboligase